MMKRLSRIDSTCRITVADLDAAQQFFFGLGFESEGRADMRANSSTPSSGSPTPESGS